MASTREQVLTCVLSKLQALYELPHPKAAPEYAAMVGIYVEQLQPFDTWELQEGLSVMIQGRKSRRWPSIGEIAEACAAVSRERRPPERRGRNVSLPRARPVEPVGPEERARVGAYMATLAKWEASGKLHLKDERGAYRYTLLDCKREAAQRQEKAQ